MKVFCTMITLLVATEGVLSFDLEKEWNLFQLENNRTAYITNEEKNYRMEVFKANMEKITEHNLQYDNGRKSYKMKMNQFGDITHSEFVSTMNGYKREKPVKGMYSSSYIEPVNVALAESVDWNILGAVTPVKDQGLCSSCWSFSATGALEGQHFRKTGKLVSLSEQNLIDCSGKYDNKGCDGGRMDNAFSYIKDNRGIDTDESYPYEAEDGECRYTSKSVGATLIDFVELPEGNESILMSAVATVGPISVAVDASHESFQFYSEGVYIEPNCSSIVLDHAMLVVGYGSEDGLDYWLVKNSWGEQWGDKGYVKMVRNRENSCGIATAAGYPLVNL